jgi:hypothetical protein
VKFAGIADLVVRWNYTRQGVHKLAHLPDFPEPHAIINRGRTKIWLLSDLEQFEANHPEVTSETAKQSKIVGYYLASLKKDDAPKKREASSSGKIAAVS